MALNLYFDFESTSVEIHEAEAIEGYFALCDNYKIISDYHYKSRPVFWSYEAQEIHKISYETAREYPGKKDAINSLLRWFKTLPNKPQLVCYSRPKNQLGYFHYDIALLKRELFVNFGDIFSFYKHFSDKKIHSPYLLAKKKLKLKSYKLSSVYEYLFNESFNAHNCIEDVKAMIRIDQRLNSLQILH